MQALTAAAPEPAARTRAPAPAAGGREDIAALSRAELGERLAGMGLPAFRARQLWHWVHRRGATDFDAMTTLARPLRAALAERFVVGRPATAREWRSADGTVKWLFRFADGAEAETVFIPEADRGTLCVSSQVGCTLTCAFCHTGTQRLVRNLSAGEIVGQAMAAFDALGAWPAGLAGRPVTNIVLMGMGEPLYNLDNVAVALRAVADNEGIAISRRRITLSTAGVVPEMRRCGLETGVNLAVSLHATTDEVRDALVPINRKYPLAELMAACRAYPGLNNARRITFEYVMLKGVNDSPADARALTRLIAGIPAKINLIPFNPWPGAPYECSPAAAVEAFAGIVMAAGYASPVRAPRGRDIMAACGQLKSASERLRKRARAAGPAPSATAVPAATAATGR